ncbi:10188_t:CDS:2 [Dentiscutata erythropus]|uniref:10188_t:CDS:1 n=1 Tax=Dentiscutata erythropus TaxID=1348616 RepID=A0A9N9DVM6_9GLOM|nr:10188_t:CDS:2 [Dentiscutata erythropus]
MFFGIYALAKEQLNFVDAFVKIYLAVKIYLIAVNAIWIGIYEAGAAKSLSECQNYFNNLSNSSPYVSSTLINDEGNFACSVYDGGASIGAWVALFALGILPSPYLYLTLKFYAVQLRIKQLLNKRQENQQQQQPTTVVNVYQVGTPQYDMVQTPVRYE